MEFLSSKARFAILHTTVHCQNMQYLLKCAGKQFVYSFVTHQTDSILSGSTHTRSMVYALANTIYI